MKVETPILKRLGPIPFWRGHERCLDSLEAIYRRAAEKARRALIPAGGASTPAARRRP